jgi:hypothetical protein
MKTDIRDAKIGDFVVFTKGRNHKKMFLVGKKDSFSVILTYPDSGETCVKSELAAWDAYDDYVICENEHEILLAKLKYV